MKRGDFVLVWGSRLGVVRKAEGAGIHIELVDGLDPPAGYSAWWPESEVEPAPREYQLGLFR